MEGFEEELTEWLTQAGAQQLSVTVAKNMLLQNIRQMVYYILSEYHFTDKFREKWSQMPELFADIGAAGSGKELKEKILKNIGNFRAAGFGRRCGKSAYGSAELH